MIPIKGASVYGKPVASMPRKRNKNGVYLTEIGTDTAKEQIYNRFTLTPEGDEPLPGAVHFPNNPDIFDLTEAQQLTAEEQVENGWMAGKNTVGQQKRRNEALDCFVYALAALRISISAGSWISVHCWRACRKRMVQQPTRKHWQITPVPYPERMNDATGRTCRCPCGTA